MKLNRIGSAIAAVALPCVLLAQAPPAAPAKPDSPEEKALIEKTKKAAGTKWAGEEHFFCEAPRANRADDPVIPATQIFDNVYIIGNSGTAAYIFKTSAGLLMLDSMAANQVDSQVLPGFQKLGLNPADVKIIVMGHGHADHFGGSPYFQEHFGSKVYISTADWDMMEHPPANQKKKGPPQVLPKHDADVKEGEPIVLGDFKMMPVAIPGHTPGSMGYIFQVKDNGKTHTVGIYGGTVLTPGPVSDANLELYVKSVQHFEAETKKAKVDTIMQNHPLMYDLPAMLDQLQSRPKGGPNPFIVGQSEYQKFLKVMEMCSEVNVMRRKS
jgi:metallo-beta-lactamase class B